MPKNIHMLIFITSILEGLYKLKSSTTSVKYVAFWQRTLIHMLSTTSWVVMHPLPLSQPCTKKDYNSNVKLHSFIITFI